PSSVSLARAKTRDQRLVDVTAMADSDDTEHSCARVALVDDPVPPDAIAPLAFEFSDEGDALVRVRAASTQVRADPALQVRREMPDDAGPQLPQDGPSQGPRPHPLRRSRPPSSAVCPDRATPSRAPLQQAAAACWRSRQRWEHAAAAGGGGRWQW